MCKPIRLSRSVKESVLWAFHRYIAYIKWICIISIGYPYCCSNRHSAPLDLVRRFFLVQNSSGHLSAYRSGQSLFIYVFQIFLLLFDFLTGMIPSSPRCICQCTLMVHGNCAYANGLHGTYAPGSGRVRNVRNVASNFIFDHCPSTFPRKSIEHLMKSSACPGR